MKDVLATGQIRGKTHAQFKDGGNASVNVNIAFRRLQGAGNHLQQRGFARAVLADDPDGLARLDGKADVLEHPMLFTGFGGYAEPTAYALELGGVDAISLAKVIYS